MSQHIDRLFENYLNGTCTSGEWNELLALISQIDENDTETLSGPMLTLWEKARNKELPSTALMLEREKIYKSVTQEEETGITSMADGSFRSAHRVHFLKTSWFRYAAAVVVLLGGAGSYFWLSERQSGTVATTNGSKQLQTDILPGTNRVTLTVGDQTIDLSTNKTGIVVGGTITYTDGERIADAGRMLKLALPRGGGQYQAELPDGSRVWLNAASSIKFPSKFTGSSREVEISGEAYLEVAQNVKQPFVVKAGGTEIRVLGTSFNVNAYPDENMVKTTLVEGSVKVKVGEKESLLKPGQQAQSINDQLTVVDNQSEAALAWKNGLFQFDQATVPAIMRQIGRWYNLDIHYAGAVPDRIFKGKLQRSLPLSGILSLLEKGGMHFRLEGKSLTVLP